MKTKEVIKLIGKTGAGIGAYKIIGTATNVVMSATPLGPVMKVCVMLGSFTIGSIVGDKVEKYFENTVDEVASLFEKSDEKLEEVKVEEIKEGV